MNLRGARVARALPTFCNHLEELQTVLSEVELNINNAPLTYVYPNTIEICNTQSFVIWQNHNINCS